MGFTDKHGLIFIDILYKIIEEKNQVKINYVIKDKKNKRKGENENDRNDRRSN